jgi:hypothetical protein
MWEEPGYGVASGDKYELDLHTDEALDQLTGLF